MNLRTAIRRQERNIKKQIDVNCGRSARSGLSATLPLTRNGRIARDTTRVGLDTIAAT